MPTYSIHFKCKHLYIIVVKHDVIKQLKWKRWEGGEGGGFTAYVLHMYFTSLVTLQTSSKAWKCVDSLACMVMSSIYSGILSVSPQCKNVNLSAVILQPGGCLHPTLNDVCTNHNDMTTYSKYGSHGDYIKHVTMLTSYIKVCLLCFHRLLIIQFTLLSCGCRLIFKIRDMEWEWDFVCR